MSEPKPKQVIPVGGHLVALPEGVSVTDWSLERLNYQNPRIRAYLGCIRLLESVLESNYAILHCSPERLLDIWRKVRQVSQIIGTRIAPLLAAPSCVPVLEEARQNAQVAVEMLARYVLRELDRFPEDVKPDQLMEVRKLLCVSIGQIHSFLQDTFGELMAKDPRSLHDADYFLSKRFPKDIEEAEWLHSTLLRLRSYLEKLDLVRPQHLTAIAGQVAREETIPTRAAWRGTKLFLEILLNGLTPKLKEILPLRGVRFYEMELLDRYAMEIPTRCRILLDLHEIGSATVEALKGAGGPSRQEREQNVKDLLSCHAVLGRRLVHLIQDVERLLQDLVAFVPLWLEAVEKRRALLLKRSTDEKGGDGPDRDPSADDDLESLLG